MFGEWDRYLLRWCNVVAASMNDDMYGSISSYRVVSSREGV